MRQRIYEGDDERMNRTADNWIIGAATLPFPATLPDGQSIQDAHASEWRRVFREISLAGFQHVDLTDTWLRPGDLSTDRQQELADALRQEGLGVSAITAIRQSVIDPDEEAAAAYLAYTLRTVKAAAAIGTSVVSIGLHRPLTAAQQAAEWFWTEPGATDPIGDERTWNLAVERLRQVGRQAADRGLQVSLEMYEDTYLGTADSAVALIRDIDLPNVGLNPDIGNLVRAHRPIESWQDVLRKTLPYTNYWHVKNYFRSYDPATNAYFTVPTSMELGIVNYRWAVETALASRFNGPICVEHYGGDGLSVCVSNERYLRSILSTKLAMLDAQLAPAQALA
jgi:sugar phosphate isomerase/epimerase